MRAGMLRHRLALQSYTATQNEFGEEVKAWATQRTVWGSVEPLTGREYLEARATTQTVTHRIRIRHQPDLTVTPTWRVSWDGRTFDVESVLNTGERDKELVLMAVENV